MIDKENPDFEIINVNTNELTDEEREIVEDEDYITAIGLASRLMDVYEPSFVLVGSPLLRTTPNGFLYPAEIGISINSNLSITKSGMALILREIADMLDEDINKVMAFVQEATGNNDDE